MTMSAMKYRHRNDDADAVQHAALWIKRRNVLYLRPTPRLTVQTSSYGE